MVTYCCVPCCKNIKRPGLSFHLFPRDPVLRKLWITKTRRDQGKCVPVSNTMRVCSEHFIPADFREMINGSERYKALKKDAVPSVFKFDKMKPPRRRPVQEDAVNLKKPLNIPQQEAEQEQCQQQEPKQQLDAFAASTYEVAQKARCKSTELLEKIKLKLKEANCKNIVLEPIEKSSNKEESLNERFKQKMEECDVTSNARLSKSDFCMSRVKAVPDLLAYYTGFESVEVYDIFHNFANPNRELSFSEALSEDDQMLLVLSKLRQGFDDIDLSFRFNLSTSLVAHIFEGWINEMYFRFGCLDIWPHRDIILCHSPSDSKEKHPNCVIILETTEIKTEPHSFLDPQSQSYSSYESTDTLKGLVGCDANGAIIFISQLFGGSISDKQITQESGLYKRLSRKLDVKEILPGDAVKVDKGFNILKEMKKLGLTLNVLPTADCDQLTEEHVHDTKKIASCQVKAAIRRLKAFKILSGVVPLATLPHINQVWTVCCVLTGFHRPSRKSLVMEDC